ncbi:MAG: hypothetical protein HFJ55_06635 [Clostridia bacterium]|nr:hypothetical protein [Clostridia bacterium]
MRKVVSIIITIIFLILTSTISYADTNVDWTLSSETQKLYEEETIVLTLKMEKLESISKGVNAYKAKLQYDENIFEEVRQEDFKSLNKWDKLKYNPSTKEFVAISVEGVTNKQEIIDVTLKVKKGAKAGKTSISVTDIVCSEGKKDIEGTQVSKEVEIIKEATNPDNPNPGNPDNPNPGNPDSPNPDVPDTPDNSGDSNTNNPSGPDGSQKPNSDKTNTPDGNKNEATSKLPKTGIGGYTWLYILIVIQCIIAIILFKKYKNVNKKISKKTMMLMTIIGTAFISAQFIGTTYAAIDKLKGELDDIGVIDMLDVEVLERHLINLEKLPKEKEWNADMNSDSKITVTDLSLLVIKVEEKRDYTVELDNINVSNYYINRNEEIVVEFLVDINYKDTDVEKMIINGEEYNIEKPNDTRNTYAVKLNPGEKQGIHDYKFTKVILSTGAEVKVDYEFSIVVLKQRPEIQNYKFEENFEGKAQITFDLVDKENTVQNAKLTVYEKTNEQTRSEIYTEDIAVGNNKKEIFVEDGKSYIAEIIIDYETAPEQLEDKEHYDDKLLYQKEFKSGLDYNFKISNIKTLKDGEESRSFARKEQIQISFTSTNEAFETTQASNFEPSRITINGKEYEVTKEENVYKATIDGIEEAGEKTITIEKVTLGNGKEFILEKDNNIKIIIDENKPIITDFEAQENIENNNIKFTFNISDKEKMIKTARIELYDSGENIIERKEITLEEIENGAIEKTLSTRRTNKYTVKVIITYEGETAEESVLFEKEIPAIILVNVTNSEIDKTQIEKNEKVKITYEIETNSNSEISKIRVNSVNYEVNKIEEGKYEVTVNTSDKAQVYQLEATAVIFEDETEIEIEDNLEVTILKDIPQVLEIKQEDNIVDNQVTVTYRLMNTDNNYINGKVQLVKAEDSTDENAEEQELNVDETGHGRITFENVEENIEYIAKFTITYNRHPKDGEGKDETKVVAQEPILLIRDYNLQVSNIKTLNSEKETKYFDKNEEIILSFTATNESKFVPEKAVIDNNEYELAKKEGSQNTYTVKLPSYDTYGKKEIQLQTIILDNKRFLDVTNGTIEVEVTKDKPTITDFGYKEDVDDENKVIATFNLKDLEETLIEGTITITDDHQKVLKTQKLQNNNNEITFDKTNSEYYTIKVMADYCLDDNKEGDSTNKYLNKELLNEEINFIYRKVEMKDILDIALYKNDGENVTELTTVEIPELENKEQYLVNVQMKDMPSFYATIKEYYVENGELKFELEYENVIQYKDGLRQDKLEVTYGTVKGNTATNNSFSSLIMQMRKNPGGTFVLTRDYDASGFNGDSRSLVGANITFSGTLDGNGHTIYNLSRPIFDLMREATVKNLIIEDAYIANSTTLAGMAPLVNDATRGCTISNVHTKNVTIKTSYMNSGFGGIVGKFRVGRIENCSATNLNIAGPSKNSPVQDSSQDVGGIAGFIVSTTIENCYAEGNIAGRSKIGGIVGGLEPYVNTTSHIKHCISKVNLISDQGPSQSGGIVGYARNAGQIKLTQNINLGSGSRAYRIHGGIATLDTSTDNYTINESTLTANTNNHIKTITKDEFNADICREAGFNEKIWNLENCSYDKLPTLNNLDPNNQKEEEGQSSDIYIPNHDMLKQMADYNPNKVIAYSNLYKLMPFFDSRYLVIDGRKIMEDDILNQKQIKTILPYNTEDRVMFALTEENYKTIKKIRLVFEDNEVKDYALTYKSMYGHVASYKIDELRIEYTFDGYVIKQDATIIKELVDYIKSLEYEKDLKGMVTLDRGHPAYQVNFNEKIRTEEIATNFIINYLGNSKGYCISQENEILNKITRNKLNNNQMKRLLFAYNYYSRMYGVEIGGSNVCDVMLFRGDLYRKNMKVDSFITEFWNSKWKNSHVLYQFYRDNLGPLVGIQEIYGLIEYNIDILTEYDDPNDWFVDNFNGFVTESPSKGYEDVVDYRAWTQLKKQATYILPMLTLPDNAGYIVSAPTTFAIGSSRVYMTNPEDERQKEAMIKKMQAYGDNMANFYATAVGFIDKSYLNRVCDVQIDTRFLPGLGEQSNGKTNDLFHKGVNEILNEWSMIRAVSAYAGSQRVYWVVDHALDTFTRGWTHETGHNQVNSVFFKNSGFRPIGGGSNGTDSGGEDYTDGNIAQGGGDGAVNFNLCFNYSPEQLVTTNLTTERINSTEKIESYYKKMFETIDYLDYVEAKAFLKLTPEEQSKVAVQIFYPDSSGTTGWRVLTKEDFEEMNLKTIEDIYNNKITIRPGVTGTSTQTAIGQYGYENMYIRRWYQPHNDNGRTHTYGFTYTAWQMLGIGGYDGGYITYFSGKSRNDLDAIRKVTKDSEMTWKKFKLGRYELMENSLNTIPYVNSSSLEEKYVEALKLDAANSDRNVTNSTNIRRRNYHYLKRVTNDFREEVLDGNINIIPIKTADELREKITQNPYAYYTLENDIDLSGITEGTSIISNTFMGKLDGKGHKLTGNTMPIFGNIKFAHISNLIVEDSNITSNLSDVGAFAKTISYSELEDVIGRNITVNSTNKQIGALVGSMASSYVKNIHITEATISGTTRVGIMAGYVSQSQIEESTTNGKVVGTGNACGGFIGEIIQKTTIQNCYSMGEVQGNQDIGGFIGYVNGSTISNSFSMCKAKGNAGTASFVGQTINNSSIKNNITLVNQVGGYKFDGRTANNKFTNFVNNYENEDNIGQSTLLRAGIDFAGKISVTTGNDIVKESFYTETLGWNNSIWDFSRVANNGVPKLRNADPNDYTNVEEIYTITNANEFKEQIKAHPNATFNIKNDIDLSTLEGETAIIDVEFVGKIKGNNNTLRGNKLPIFQKLNSSQIFDLKIEGSQIETSQKDIGALAKAAQYARLENIVVKDITINTTNEQIGGLVGNMVYTSIKNVHIIGANISGTRRVGTLSGYAGACNIAECSTNGIVVGSGNACGGFIGEIYSNSTIRNCYSIGEVSGRQDTGGFCGYVNSSSIINSFSRCKARGNEGTASFVGQTANNATIQNNITFANQSVGYKFDGRTANNRFTNFANNYENKESSGKSTLTRTDVDFTGKIKLATKEELRSQNFYTETLGWENTIWNFNGLSNGEVPKLRNLDPNSNITIDEKYNVSTAEEFQEQIKAHPDAIIILESDIDLSTINTTTIIDVEFMGILEGNNHTLSGNIVPIFHKLNGAVIRNLKLENSNVTVRQKDGGAIANQAQNVKIENVVAKNIKVVSNNEEVGGLFGIMAYSTMKNVHIMEGSISGTNKVGGIAGYVGYSIIEECSSNVVAISSGNACGGIIGSLINQSTIQNCYSVGNCSGNLDVGGLVGNLSDSTIANCFSTVIVTARQGGASLVGVSQGSSVRNNITLADQYNQYKFDGRTVAEQFERYEGNYEYENNRGISTLTREGIDFEGKIGVATQQDIKNRDFYINTLGWDLNIWDFTNVMLGATPKLRNADPNEMIQIGEIKNYEIHTADEFITLLKSYPQANFSIQEDLDFSSKKYDVLKDVIIIPGVFYGEIQGNNHKITNLKDAILFEQFEGKVDGLNIEKYSLGETNKFRNQKAIFAKKANGAKFSNMKFNDIKMYGNNAIAVVAVEDKDSTYENISVTNVYLEGMYYSAQMALGNNITGFITTKTGGSIKNCYVQGEIKAAGRKNAGILAKTTGDVLIENVVANVKVTCSDTALNEEKSATNSGFIAEIEGNLKIKNSASIAQQENSASKFVPAEQETISTVFQNCYENADVTGKSNSNGVNIKEATKAKLLTKQFYTDILHLNEAIWDLDNIQEISQIIHLGLK